MNTKLALVAGLVSLLATVAGCARPDVVPAAASPRPVVAYGVAAGPDAGEAAHRAARFEAVPAPQPRLGLIGFGGNGVSPIVHP